MVKGNDTGLLSQIFVQVIFGVGLPSAVHARATESVSLTVLLIEMLIMVGASTQEMNTIE